MRAFHTTAAPQFPVIAGKTYSRYCVWKDSARAEVKFSPLGADRKSSRRAAREIFEHARSFERRTATTRVDAFGRRHHQGVLGRMGLMVLQAMLFKFINHSSGRLDPSYDALAAEAIISRRSVARALERLRDAGIVSWVRRCSESYDDSRYVLEQDTNAYGISAPGCWKGYKAPPAPPPPAPESWGATPALPALPILAVAARQAGDRRRAAHLLDCAPPDDWLARAARRLLPPDAV